MGGTVKRSPACPCFFTHGQRMGPHHPSLFYAKLCLDDMNITYDEKEDIIFIKLNNEPITKDVSYSWNVNIGLTEKGIGEITLLDAKDKHYLPLTIPENLIKKEFAVIES